MIIKDLKLTSLTKKYCHQLCSISFRARNGSCYSQQHRNSLSFGELFKLFDWDVYAEEQKQIVKVSVKECSLNSDHRKKCEESSQTKIALTPDELSTIRRSNCYVEECMPLAQTPRLDLYFDNSELTTFALLNTACIKFLCKNNDEYCLLKLSPHHSCYSQLLTSTPQMTKHGKRKSCNNVSEKKEKRHKIND